MSMDVIVHMHVIPSIGTLTEKKAKNQVCLKLDMYFNKLMCIATSANLVISTDTMHQDFHWSNRTQDNDAHAIKQVG